jgi:hypothetical protein
MILMLIYSFLIHLITKILGKKHFKENCFQLSKLNWQQRARKDNVEGPIGIKLLKNQIIFRQRGSS